LVSAFFSPTPDAKGILYNSCILFQEVEWPVLELLMEGLPHLLKNKILLSTAHTEDIEKLTKRLCIMVFYNLYTGIVAPIIDF